MSSIAVIGELNLDLIVTEVPHLGRLGEETIVGGIKLTLGSSAAIMACQLAQLGDDVLLFSKVGDDDFGRRARDFLRVKGVGTDAVMVDSSVATGLTISIAIDSERSQMTFRGCIDDLRYADIDSARLRDCTHLHISSFFLQRKLRPDIPRIFARAKEMGLTTSLDTGWPHEGENPRDLDLVWPHVDVFLPNDLEAMRLTGEEEPTRALDALARRVKTVVMKTGPRGAEVRQGDKHVKRAGFEIDVIDTTGAGDSFNAGFLHGWLADWDLADCLDFGNACGALSIRSPGGTTSQPTPDKAQRFIQTAPRRLPG